MLETIVLNLQTLLRTMREDRAQKSAHQDLALSALMTATMETRLYLDRAGKGRRKRVRSDEERLVRLWAAAAVPLRHFNKDLAERCTMKADFWLNPENYSEEDIARLRIGIDEVYREARELL